MKFAAVFWFLHLVLASLFLCDASFAQTPRDRDVYQIQFEGLQRISSASLHRKLASLPEIFEASHFSVKQSTYERRVREAVARGLLASGFLDRRVKQVDGPDRLTLTIQEGPHFHRGLITIEDASKEVNEWVGSQLLIASAADEDSSPVWELGSPADGTTKGKELRCHAIQERLTEIGLHGKDATIQFIRNDLLRTQTLQIQLSSADRSWEHPTRSAAAEAELRSGNPVAGNGEMLSGIEKELRQIYRRWLSSPTGGLRLVHLQDGMRGRYLFGQESAVAIVEYDSQHRKFVLANGHVLICMDDPPAAIRLPLPDASAVVHLKSVGESEDERTMEISVESALTSDRSAGPGRMGVVFSEKGWAEWFPPDAIERTEDANGVTYLFQDHRLQMDHEGHLINLSGTDSSGRWFQIDLLSEDELQAETSEIIQAFEPIELFVFDRQTGHQLSLSDMFQAFFEDIANEGLNTVPDFQRDSMGFLILWTVNHGVIVEPQSLLGRLAKLYALEVSQRRKGLAERMMELEHEAMRGPLTSTIMADLWMRQGNIERALRALRRARELSGDPSAVQSDIKLLVDSSNLFGRICEQVDLKAWIQQSAQLAEPFADEDMLAFVKSLAALMPDANTEQERRRNAERLLTFAYEIVGKAVLEDHLMDQIQRLESQPPNIAEKKEKDQEKRLTR